MALAIGGLDGYQSGELSAHDFLSLLKLAAFKDQLEGLLAYQSATTKDGLKTIRLLRGLHAGLLLHAVLPLAEEDIQPDISRLENILAEGQFQMSNVEQNGLRLEYLSKTCSRETHFRPMDP